MALRLALLLAGLILLAACEDPPGYLENDDDLLDLWGDDFPAPRGLEAMGGDGFNLVTSAPVVWAETHRLQASRQEDFSGDVIELDHVDGQAVHEGLPAGQTWYYRAIAEVMDERSGELLGRSSRVVSAAPRESQVLALYIEMDPSDLDELYSRDVHSDDLLDARVFVGATNGPELDVRGMRFRGSTTRTYDKKGFNIRLEDRPELDDFPDFNFRSEDRGAGNRIILNALYTDPSAMREALNFAMFRELGLPASQTFFTELYINGIFEGLYIGIERLDREALRGWGFQRSHGSFTMVRDELKSSPHRQTLGERSMFGVDMDAAAGSDAERLALLEEIFNSRGEEDEQNWEELLALLRWTHDTPAGADFALGFEERFDVDQVIDFLAIHILTHDRDSLDIDYWLYRDDEADGPWTFIPWDKNLTFGHHYFSGHQGINDFMAYDRDYLPTLTNDLITKFLATPDLRSQLDARTVELATEVFTDQWFEERVAELADQVGPSMARVPDDSSFVVHPQQTHSQSGWLQAHQDALLSFVSLRRSYVLDHLDAAAPLVEDGLRLVVDGLVIAEINPHGQASGQWSVRLVEEEDPDWVGVNRVWEIEVTEPLSADLTLYWRHSPQESWYRQLSMPGRQWYLDAHLEDDEGWTRVSSRTLPFANQTTVPVELEGTTRWRVSY